MVNRKFPGGRQWRGHAGLQYSIAAHHHATTGVELGLIVGVGSNANQRPQATGRQLRVTVQREHVGGVCRHLRRVTQIKKLGPVTFCQSSHQPFDLSTLALPTDPALFGQTVPTSPMQHPESGHQLGLLLEPGIACIQRPDACYGLIQMFGVRVHLSTVSIGPVGQKKKLCMCFWISQVMEFQASEEVTGGTDAGQHARNHHHDTLRSRYAPGKLQSRHMLGPNGFADHPMHEGNHSFGCRKCSQDNAHAEQQRSD